jgi:hypothetical protein
VTSNIRVAAQQEAARLELARTLAADADPLPIEPRPCATIFRGRATRRAYWLFQFPCVDQNRQVVWEAYTAFSARVHGDTSSMNDVRGWITITTALLSDIAAREQRLVLARATASTQAAIALALRRERAIEQVLASRHARLSAAVIQRGLFDRRGERAAAAQKAVIELALEYCRSRLRELEAASSISADESSLAFAVLLR